MKFIKANVESIGDGKAIKIVDFELEKVIENCKDLNTDPGFVREVTLKIKVKPTPDRERAGISFQASSKLAPDSAVEDQIVIARDGAFVANAKQLTLDEYENVEEIDDDESEGTND
jgi:hypothetical protein